MDEGSEVKDERGAAISADFIPGAELAVAALKEMGFRLGLVADGPVATFRTLLGHAGLWDAFEARAISEEVGVEKPDPAMFLRALESMGIGASEYGRVAMVGNNLERDIAGANRLGLASVWMDWSPRRRKVVLHPDEEPCYRITSPSELPSLASRLERALRAGETIARCNY